MGPALQRLVVRWAESRPADDTASHTYFAVMTRNSPVPEAVPLLTRLAKDKKAALWSVRFVAILALGTIKDHAAVTALEELKTENTDIGGAWLGDCALAELIRLRGKKTDDYGLVQRVRTKFKAWGMGETVIVSESVFPNGRSRQRGWEKWKDESNKK